MYRNYHYLDLNSKKLYNMLMAPKGSITNIIVKIDMTCQIFVCRCVNIKMTHVGLVNCYYHKDRF
jgi:hypothetical protein